jgi:hypothetical protein
LAFAGWPGISSADQGSKLSLGSGNLLSPWTIGISGQEKIFKLGSNLLIRGETEIVSTSQAIPHCGNDVKASAVVSRIHPGHNADKPVKILVPNLGNAFKGQRFFGHKMKVILR